MIPTDIDGKQYTNSQIASIINEHIHNEKYREILKLRYMDGLTYERIAERADMSVQQIKTIVKRNKKELFSHL